MAIDLPELLEDLEAESAELDVRLDGLTPEQWNLDTPAPGWTIADQVSHLAYFDDAAALSSADADRFRTDADDLDQLLGEGCAPTSAPYEVAGSLLNVSLPTGATILHCHDCRRGSQVELSEHDSTVLPDDGVPDASVLTTTTPAIPVTATWTFEIHDTVFAWAANGLTAEASLPIVNFQNDGNTGYGNVTVTYRIPGGKSYDWNDRPATPTN